MGARGLLARAGRALLDVLLPPLCALCRAGEPAAGLPVCPRCAPRLRPLDEPWCTVCAEPFAGPGPSHPCPRCRSDPPPFRELRAWGRYEAGLLELIQAVKFGGRHELRGALGELFQAGLERHRPGAPPAAVVPVPASVHALGRRGFDLAGYLSRRASRALGVPWRPFALTRRPDAPHLVGLSSAERLKAARRAFAPRERLSGSVLLVDDVATSTATARACARACLRAGAREVRVLVLARTPPP